MAGEDRLKEAPASGARIRTGEPVMASKRIVHPPPLALTRGRISPGRRRAPVRLMMAVATLWLPCAAVAPADTLSAAVGVLCFEIPAGLTGTLSVPLWEGTERPAAAAVRAWLAGAAGDGDRLHLWAGRHFLTYERRATDWCLAGTDVPMPAHRLTAGVGQGYLVTRQAPGALSLVLAGAVPLAPSTPVVVAAQGWELIAHPYPLAGTVADILPLGLDAGDELRIWDPWLEEWLAFAWNGLQWQGAAAPDSVPIAVGESMLFFNAAPVSKTLIFERPYASAGIE
jgi:hypothetical protein